MPIVEFIKSNGLEILLVTNAVTSFVWAIWVTRSVRLLLKAHKRYHYLSEWFREQQRKGDDYK